MTTALAFCANTRVSRIDLAGTEPIDIPQASLRAAVHRYFGPDTGSRYWFNRAKALELNSLAEAMADKLQHLAKTCPKSATDLGPSATTTSAAPTRANTVGAPRVTSLETSANALIVAVCIPIDRNDHVCC